MSMSMKSDKLNIAMIGHKRIPSREGGVEIVVEELSTRMASMGHDVTCYNRGGHHIGGEEYDADVMDEYKGVRIKRAWTVDRKGLAAVTSSIFASIAATFSRYDVVHFHAEGPCLMCGLPRLRGKKVIVTIHGLDHQRAKWGRFASWYIMRGEKAAVKHADDIIVLSHGVQDYFMDMYGRRTVFIPNGVNKPQIQKADVIKDKWGLKKDSYILFLGRIVPEKGVHYLIEAYKEYVKCMSDDLGQGTSESGNEIKKLVIAGGSSDTSEYMDNIKMMAGDDENIIFTGFVQGEPLEELYSNAYIYCLPSDLEGMPLSLLEAMSYGNACLVSDIPECADVVGDCGVTFTKGNVSDLKDKLVSMCADAGKTLELKSRAADYITSRYNWDDVVERTLELYKK